MMETDSVAVRLTPTLTDEERQQLFGWRPDVFATDPLGLTWKRKDVHAVVTVDGRIASHAGCVEREATVAGQPVRLGGVGGVVTRPEWQGRGLARLALEHIFTYLCRELGAEFGALFCREPLVAFYAHAGWRRIDAPVTVDQPSEPIVAPLPFMVCPCADRAWPAGPINLNGLPF